MSVESDPSRELLELLIDLQAKNHSLLLNETSRVRALTSSYSENIVRLAEQLKIFLQGEWLVEVKSASSITFFPTYSSSEKSTNILKRVAKKVFNGYDSYLDLLGVCQNNYAMRVDLTIGELLDELTEMNLDGLRITKSKISKLDQKFLSQTL